MCLRVLISIAIVIMLISCRPAVEHEASVAATTSDSIIKEDEPQMVGDCYLHVSGNDSILMQIVIENNSAAGQLHYRFFEKDKSGGNLFGNMRGDTLVADYKFISEGTESEREVAFIRRGDTFVEGFGEAIERDGRMIFRDPATLKFDGQPMQKVDCNGIARYFTKK